MEKVAQDAGLRQQGSGEDVVLREAEERELSPTAWRALSEPVAFRLGEFVVLDRSQGLKAALDQLAADGLLMVLVMHRGEWVPVTEPVRFEVSRGLDSLWQRGSWRLGAVTLESAEAIAGSVSVCVERAHNDTEAVVARVEVGGSGLPQG